MNKTLTYIVKPVWSEIERIREKIQSELTGCVSRANIDFTIICVTELVENAVKYGEAVPNMQYLQFRLDLKDGEIEIGVSNGVAKQDDLSLACSIIDKINEGGDPESLYLERLMVLMERNGPGKSQLGLLRIANETGYKLRYNIDRNVLIVEANRKVN